jgi:hypothetical protein
MMADASPSDPLGDQSQSGKRSAVQLLKVVGRARSSSLQPFHKGAADILYRVVVSDREKLPYGHCLFFLRRSPRGLDRAETAGWRYLCELRIDNPAGGDREPGVRLW